MCYDYGMVISVYGMVIAMIWYEWYGSILLWYGMDGVVWYGHTMVWYGMNGMALPWDGIVWYEWYGYTMVWYCSGMVWSNFHLYESLR